MVTDDTILRHSPESIILLGPHREVLAWNEASERLYGWTSDEMVGALMHERLSCSVPDRPDLTPLDVPAHFRGIFRRVGRDGTVRRVEVLRMPYGAPGAAVPGVLEFGRDITGIAETRQCLERVAHRYENLFNAMPASLWELDISAVIERVDAWRAEGIIDLGAGLAANAGLVRDLISDTRVLGFNEASVELFGRGYRDELMGDLNALWPDESLQTFAESVVAALAGETTFSAECTLVSHSGRRFQALFTAGMPTPQLEHGRVVVSVVDLSARHPLAADSAEAEQHYRDVFEAAATANIEIDCRGLDSMLTALKASGVTNLGTYLDGHPEFIDEALGACHILSANSQFAQLLRTGSRAGARVPLARYWVRAHASYRKFLEARFHGKSRFEARVELTRFDGTSLHCLLSSMFRPLRSRPHVTVTNIVDLSGSVRAEAALARTRAGLAHAGRIVVLGELAAALAHEVSQPISSIAMDSQTALRSLSRPTPDHDELRELATRASGQATRAAAILLRIRNMARRGEPMQVPTSINGAVHDGLAVVAMQLLQGQIKTELHLAEGLPAVLGDPVQLQQVVVNLTLNASQAMGPVGTAPRRIRWTTALRGSDVWLAIDDTGPGIRPADQERLFESFYTTEEFGLGVGLPICLSIVEAHGGTIGVEPAPDGWATRFVVVLPKGGASAV